MAMAVRMAMGGAACLLWLLGAACTGTLPVASTPTSTHAAAVANATTEIRKPAIDKRQYRFLALPNGLRVLLVSDAEADKSAASLLVESGSHDEPADRPGLAHFLEHMLFLGTEKFPQPDGYQAYIGTHGGTNNAYTAADHTNYFFDIAPTHFEGALDQFAQFFIAPTFATDYVDREMKAVHSEYQMQLRDDGWRGSAVQRLAFSPAHPASRFTIGSLETLADRDGASTRDALIDFYNRHYDPRQMILALYGPQPLAALEQAAVTHFAAIPQRSQRPERAHMPLFTDEHGARLLRYKPEKNIRVLTFTFAVPPVDAYFRENPTNYLMNLLGHEGEGSLHAWLKAQGWIQSLGAGAGRVDAANALFEIEMELTEAGLQHVADIGDALFGYLALATRDGIRADAYDEQSRLAELAFDYRDPQPAASTVTALTRSLMLFPVADVLRGNAVMERFDAPLIARYLAALTAERVLVSLASPDAETAATETYFKVPYKLDVLPAAWLARWKEATPRPEFAIPGANPFVPDDLALVPEGTAPRPAPAAIGGAPGATLWHLADASFGAPRANVIVRLGSCAPMAPVDVAYATLYARLVQDHLNTFAYPALLAGLAFTVDVDERGLRVAISGYADKQDVLLDAALTALATQPIRDDRFAVMREQLLLDWANFIRERPATQAMTELGRLVNRPSTDPEELSAALQPATPATLDVWRRRMLQASTVELLAHGNVNANEAAGLRDIALRHVPARGCRTPRRDVVEMTTAQVRELRIPHDDAAFVLYVQGETRSDAERARFGLLAHMLREAYFTDLRTERQFGYLVSASPAVFSRVPGLTFVVQSPVAAPDQILQATQAFLTAYADTLAGLDEVGFDAERSGFLTRLLARDRNLTDRTARFARDLDDDTYTFDTRERIAAVVGQLTLADMRAFYSHVLALAQKRTLTVFSRGRFESGVAGSRIEDRAAFHASSKALPR